jgi:hypothetical protein
VSGGLFPWSSVHHHSRVASGAEERSLMDIVDKVRKLVALTASDREEEARTAAYLACKLIRQHSLVISYVGFEPTRKKTPMPRAKDPWRIIKAKFSGYCRSCGEDWDEGQTIVWAKGEGARCIDCGREEGNVT